MRILINDYSGHPFQVELSRQLARRGHDVLHVYSADFVTPKGDLIRHADDPPTFAVEPVSTGKTFTKYNLLKRRGQDKAYAALVRIKIAAFKPDLFVGCNNPLDAQKNIQDFCREKKVAFIFWLQDLYSLAIKSILEKKLSLPGHLIGLWYERMERAMLRRSDHVIPIADDFLQRLTTWGVPSSKITVIENWASIEKIRPGARENAWRQAQNLGDARVVLYSGTLGLKHNPDLLLSTAKALADTPDVHVIVTSEGKYADELGEKAKALGLRNLRVLPFQPFETYPQVLATADVLVAMIEPDAASYSVPSKVLSYLCAGRPIILSAKSENLAARIVSRADAGCVIEPQDEGGLIATIESYLTDTERRKHTGAAARLYAEEAFGIEGIAVRFESIFKSCYDS